MRALVKRLHLAIPPLLAVSMVGVAAAYQDGPGASAPSAAAPAPAQLASAPSVWHPLSPDMIGECGGPDFGRDGSEAFYGVDGSYLHLRLCVAGVPGWQHGPSGWTDARYKWYIDSPGGRYMVLVEDADLAAADTGGLASDGRGEVTFLDDRNGNGRFADDWAVAMPPAYIDNSIHSPLWRRSWSMSTGPSQSSSGGAVSDVGFRLGNAGCGQVVDVYVNLGLIGRPSDACLTWATDGEGLALDSRPQCDTAPSRECHPLSEVPPTEPPPPTARPTATNTATPVIPTPTSTDEPTPTPPVPTATEQPTQTPLPSTATAAVPSSTPTAEPATATDAPTATAQPGATQTAPPTAHVTATATVSASGATPTAGGVIASPTAPGSVASPSATPASGTALPGPTATPTHMPQTGNAVVCVQAVIGGNVVPFPDRAVVNLVLLTPWGWPAMQPMTAGIGHDSCARFFNLEPGQYRTWVSVPTGWNLYPGTPPSQTLWIAPDQPAPSQVVFRYQPSAGGSVPPGVVPSPPGPPTSTTPGAAPPGSTPGVVPPGTGTPGVPPVVPTETSAVPSPPGPPTAYPESPDRPSVGSAVQLPILGYEGNDAVCSSWVEVQNIGDRPAKGLLLVWGEPGFCPPQCAGPLKVECSGLLAPGSSWNFLGGQMPNSAKSGLVISANADDMGEDVFADALCETLFQNVVGNCDEYRRFRKAYDELGQWRGFDFGYAPRQPLAVEVLRNCPGDVRPSVRVTSSYAGVAGEFLGHYDPVYGGHAFYVPSLFASTGGFTSVVYIQNAGLECTSIELWLKGYEDCLHPRICDILTLAPGETHQLDASSCMPVGWQGGAWVRASQPLAIAVDHIGNDVLMTYTGMPSELNYTFNGEPLFTTGSAVAYGPLIYSEYQGWDTSIVVQNMSRVTAAKVKVYFLDRSGDIITTVVDWICPQGAQSFFLPVVSDLPGNWIGSVRVESQDWFAAGGPTVSAPNIQAVALLMQYTDIARSEAQEALAYNLFPEQLAYDWSLGSGTGGVKSGVGRIGIPSFLKDQHGTGVTSEIAIANVVPKPGITNFAIFIYDQNGLIDYLCETLSSQQVEYINLDTWGFIHPGFKGSAVISATFWEHEVFDYQGGFMRNVVGLAAVKVERTGTNLGNPVPGDESAGNMGFPIPGPFNFAGPSAPNCPGQPGGGTSPSVPTPTASPGGQPTPPGPPPPP